LQILELKQTSSLAHALLGLPSTSNKLTHLIRSSHFFIVQYIIEISTFSLYIYIYNFSIGVFQYKVGKQIGWDYTRRLVTLSKREVKDQREKKKIRRS